MSLTQKERGFIVWIILKMGRLMMIGLTAEDTDKASKRIGDEFDNLTAICRNWIDHGEVDGPDKV